MALFPKIESPCPYKDDLSAIMDGDVCTMCERNVFDLTAISDDERVSFLSTCSGEVCVSYTFPVVKAAAATAIASAALLSAPAVSAQSADDLYCYDDMVIIVGGLRKGKDAKMVEVKSDLPDLPVVYESDAQMDAFNKMFGMVDADQPGEKRPVKYADAEKALETAIMPVSKTSLARTERETQTRTQKD